MTEGSFQSVEEINNDVYELKKNKCLDEWSQESKIKRAGKGRQIEKIRNKSERSNRSRIGNVKAIKKQKLHLKHVPPQLVWPWKRLGRGPSTPGLQKGRRLGFPGKSRISVTNKSISRHGRNCRDDSRWSCPKSIWWEPVKSTRPSTWSP